MEENEEQTLANLKACRSIIDGLIKEHHGRIFNTAGDSVLAEFQSAVEAVICASEFQNTIKERNNSVSEEEQMQFRLGINMGDVVIEGDNLYRRGSQCSRTAGGARTVRRNLPVKKCSRNS